MTKKKIGNMLKRYRKQSGYHQGDIALKLNVSQNTISKWEMGEALPQGEMGKKVFDLFNIDIKETDSFKRGNLGWKLKLLRIAEGLRIEDLHSVLTVSQYNISKIERGEKMPSDRQLRAYIHFFGVTEDILDITLNKETIGTRIKDLRFSNDMKVKDFANFMGVSTTTVHKWENDEALPSKERIVDMAYILGYPVQAFLEDDDGNSFDGVDNRYEELVLSKHYIH